MLQETQLNPAVMLAESLNAQGLYIAAEPGTPLSELVGTMGLNQADVIPLNSPSDYQPNIAFYKDQAASFGAGLRGYEVPHSEKMEELATSIAAAVRNHLAFARTTVSPLVGELSESYGRFAKEFKIDPAARMKVVAVDLPAPCQDSEILDMVKDFKLKPQGAPSQGLYFLEPRSPAEIRELASKAYSSPSITAWLAGLSDAFLTEAYMVIFGQAKPKNMVTFQSLKMGRDGASACLLTALIASAVFDNPPADTSVGLSEYNTALSKLRNQACLRLSYLVDEHVAKAEMGYLILSFDREAVYVVGDVYRKWREQSGTDQLIIASILMKEPLKTVTNIEEARARLESKYATYLAVTRSAMEANRAVMLRNILRDEALKLVCRNAKAIYANCTDTKLWGDEFIDPRLGEYEKFKMMLDDYCAKASIDRLDNIWQVSLDVVCDCVFNFADSAGLILRGIESYSAKNPNLPVAEAAALSAADYVLRYFCDQLQIRRINN